MRKSNIIFAAVAAAVLSASCQKVYVEPESPSSVVFEAQIGSLSRTTLDGVRVEWEDGDEVDIVSGSGVVTYVATPSRTDPRTATFTKKNSADPEPTPLPASYGMGSYAAMYPSGLVKISGGVPEVIFPSVQHSTSPGCIRESNVMFAFSESHSLTFQNAFGLLSVELKGSRTVKSIEVSTKQTNISGLFDLPSFAMSTDPALAKTRVTLDCGDGIGLTSDGVKFHIGIPGVTIPKGEMTITVTATDGATATISNNGAAAEFRMGHISPFSWTPDFKSAPAAMDGDDWLETYLSGQDITVGGITVNKTGYPRYASVRLSQIASGSAFASDYLNGMYDVVFLDYDPSSDEGLDKVEIQGPGLSLPSGVAIIGRYSSHHSEIVLSGSSMMPKGSLALKNVCVRSNTWALQTEEMQKDACRFDIEDCAFYIAPEAGVQGGLISDNCTSTGDVSTVLGYLTLRNSVVVRHNDYNHPMFSCLVGCYGTIPYKDFVIENNAFIYASSIAGRDVCSSNLFYLSTDSEVKNSSMNFTFRNNSVLGYKGNGLALTCCDPKSIVFENNVIEGKLTSKIMLVNILYPYSKLKTDTSSISGNYFNNSGPFISGVDFLNGTTIKSRFSVGTQSNVATGVSPYTTVDTAIGFLGLDTSVVQDAGCSYETKTWRKWATDAGSGTEPYAPGHGSGDFNWQ